MKTENQPELPPIGESDDQKLDAGGTDNGAAAKKPKLSQAERAARDDQALRDKAEAHAAKRYDEVFEHPVPGGGGSYVREPDGSLTKQKDA